MIRKMKHNGQALVEFALVIMLLIFILTAFLDLGRGYYYYTALSNSVREGARYAVVHPMPAVGEPTIEEVVEDYSIALDPAVMTINVNFTDPDEVNVYYVTIDAIYQYSPVTPGLQALIGSPGTIPLTSQTTMKLTPYGNFVMSSSP